MAGSYKEVKAHIQQNVLSGKLKPNHRLPSGAELCRSYQVSHMTMDRALRELVNEGLLIRDRHRGTIVTERAENYRGKIGLMVTSLSSKSTLPYMVEGVESVVRNKNYHLLLVNTNASLGVAKSTVRELVSEGVAGVIYIPIGRGKEFGKNADILNFLKRNYIPFIVAGHCNLPEVGEISSVSSDHFSASRELTEHLLFCGHRRIILMGGPPNQDYLAIIEGYRSALEGKGIAVSDDWIKLIASTEMIRSEAKHLMHSVNPPDAFFALGDNCAAEIISSLRESKLNVPGDVAVVGFGDAPLCKYLPVPLTTTHVQHREEGKLLANTLIGIIEGEIKKVTQITLPCPLVIRESCGLSLNRAQLV